MMAEGEKQMKKKISVILVCLMTAVSFVMPLKAEGELYEYVIYGTENYSEAQEVLKYTNQIRAEAGAAPLVLDEKLTEWAMQRAAELPFSFSHTRPDGTDCFSVVEGTYYALGENIAIGHDDAHEVTRGKHGWEFSSGHYRNMVNTGYTAMGVGVYFAENGRRCWVQLFSDRSESTFTKTGSEKMAHVVLAPEGMTVSGTKRVQIPVNNIELPEGIREMYRLYNPNSGEHFYTAETKERNSLITVGWMYEGVGWYAPEKSEVPVYRLYNKYAGDHHYTMQEVEKEALVEAGWNDEGIGWYSDENEEIPLYRQYNPYAVSGSHNYTTNKNENDALVKAGWKEEGISWYGINP
ncbi:MAG TPA: hypothetical protein DHW39_08395 [Erysipelotrichaceae bacterium]|nr:hypothetical protein [Erysipelotrichaceae bacterium]